MRELLLNGSDTARILATNNILNHFGKYQFLLGNNFAAFNNVYGNIVIDKCQNIQIQ